MNGRQIRQNDVVSVKDGSELEMFIRGSPDFELIHEDKQEKKRKKDWKAKHSLVKLDLASGITIDSSAALDTFFSSSTAIQGSMKDVTIAEPEGDVSKIDLLGVDTNGFQNAELDEQPFGLATLTGTLVLPCLLYTSDAADVMQ